MRNTQLSDALRAVWSHRTRIGATVFFIGLILVASSVFSTAKTVYIITDGDQTTVIESYSDNTSDVLREAGIEVSPSDRVSSTDTGTSMEVRISRSQPVTVKLDGADCSLMTYPNETVGEVLARLGVELSASDIVSVDTSAQAASGMVISVTRKMVFYQNMTEAVAYTTERKPDYSMSKGTEKVTQAGVDGSRTLTYEVVYLDGQETSRQLVNTEVTGSPVTEIVSYGTRVTQAGPSDPLASVTAFAAGGGRLTTKSGSTLDYSKVITCTATAYTTEGKKYKTTSTGTKARYGAIAVDPSVIPYGTRMYIVTKDGKYIYGTAVAEDCGGSIDGNRIDLYFNTYSECIQFGRRSCTVYILK